MHAILMATSAAIILALGTLHLLYTFRGPNLTPRDPALRESMMRESPVLTRDTTMWKAWVGFNASHSMGAMLFGLVYGYLALFAPQLLFASPFLLLVGFLMLAGLAVLGRVYWFRVPFTGISMALACYVASVALALSLDLG